VARRIEWHASVDEDLHVLRIVLEGTIDLESWRTVLQKLPETPGLRPGINTLVDARAASLDFFLTGSRPLIELVKAYLGKRGGGYRSAWVVSSDLDYGVSRMVQSTLRALPIEAAVFRDIGEAEAWVTPTTGGKNVPGFRPGGPATTS